MKKPIREILDQVIATIEPGQWCTEEKATTLASMVFALRPHTVVELGVWMGGSFLPMALALKNLDGDDRKIYGVDPWSPDASVAGQDEPNAKWWGTVDHDLAYHRFLGRLHDLELKDVVNIQRATSMDAVIPAPLIDIIHIDANHGEQVRKDADRWAGRVRVGGIVIMDDVGWTGGHVLSAVKDLMGRGFTCEYDLAPGVVMQRAR